MVEEKLLVRLSGAAAEDLNELVRRGYFATKSEAIRAGILRLGESFGLFKPSMHYWRELGEEIRGSARKMGHEEILEAVSKPKIEGSYTEYYVSTSSPKLKKPIDIKKIVTEEVAKRHALQNLGEKAHVF